jgi:bidirectional [NiFe] hydrogenase diaphorase subunit
MQPANASQPQDPRYKALERAMRKHGFAKSSLIESLHAAQEAFGYLDDEAMRFVAKGLKLPLSKVYGVATFYHYFTLKPQGKHTCVICTGTACYIKGANKLLDSLCKKHKIKAGETTADGELSLVTARCLGSCGLAPMGVFDGRVVGYLDEDKTQALVEEMIK